MADKEPMMLGFEWKENPRYSDQQEFFKFEEYYNTSYIISTITKHSYKDVILQFPVENLSDAIKVQSIIQKDLPAVNIYIISDHLKNSCCVDLIGSSHINFDIIFHFGVACLSESMEQRKKIVYVLPKAHLPIEEFSEKLTAFLTIAAEAKRNIIIAVDQYQSYLNEEIVKRFSTKARLALIETDSEKLTHHLFYGFYLDEPLEANTKYEMVFTGNENSDTLEKIMFAKDKFNIEKIYVNNSSGDIVESTSTMNRLLIKRLSLIEQVRSVKCFGILIQNPNTQFCKAVTQRVKSVIKQANRKFYLFFMNNLNEAKLNNFPEVEAFVIVSCYRNSLFDIKKYYKIIVTPFELEMALRNVSFSNYFLIDGLNQEIEDLKLEEIEKEEDIGTLEQKQKIAESSTALVSVNSENKVAVMGIFQTLDHYSSRSYQGLDIKQNVEVQLATEGLSGIASSYVSDRKPE